MPPDADEDVIITLKKDKNGDFKLEYAGIRNQGKWLSLCNFLVELNAEKTAQKKERQTLTQQLNQ